MDGFAQRFAHAWRLALSFMLIAAGVGCADGPEGGGSTTDPSEDIELGETRALPLLRAKSIAKQYTPPPGPQGYADGPAFGPSFTSGAEDPQFNDRIATLGDAGASIGWGAGGWSSIDRVDELNGQAPNSTNCNDGPNPNPQDFMWEHFRPHRTVMKLEPADAGPSYCIALGELRRGLQVTRQQTKRGMHSITAIGDAPRAYSLPECVRAMNVDPGFSNACIPTAAGREHMKRLLKFYARIFDGGPHPELMDPEFPDRPFCGTEPPYCGKLTDLIVGNEVSSSGYFSIHGLPRPGGRAGTVDVTSPDLTEAEKRLWGSEYARLVQLAHDAIQETGRQDMMVWTSFNPWFRDQFYPREGAERPGWLINNQYILDALKFEVGLNADWGIGIHPYGDPATHWKKSGVQDAYPPQFWEGVRTGPNPTYYSFENLSTLRQQMRNWLSQYGNPDDFPQSKIIATEQGYDGARMKAATSSDPPPSAVPYPFSLTRDERRITEWVCRAHDTVMRNPSIIGVTNRHLQQDNGEQLREQQSGEFSWGLVPADIAHNFANDRALYAFPKAGDTIDMNRDFVSDGSAIDASSVRSPQGAIWAMPPRNRMVLDAYLATFNENVWNLNNSHPCCSEFYLGCAVTPTGANPTGTLDAQNWTEQHRFRIEGRACAPRRDAPIMVEVRTTDAQGAPIVVASAPANLPNGTAPRVFGCTDNKYKDQKYVLQFTRDQIAQHAGKSMGVYAVRPGIAPRPIGAFTMPSAVPAGYNGINGRVDELVVDTNLITLRGWACAVGTGQSIVVDVYSSPSSAPYPIGTYIKGARADFISEPALRDFCGDNSDAHRFEISFTRAEVLAHQGRSLHVYGISPVGGTNDVLPRPADFKMPALPANYQLTGSMNGRVETFLWEDSGRQALKGWACRHDDAALIKLHVYSGDSWNSPLCGPGAPAGCRAFVKEGVADSRIEPALKALCGNQGDFHRFDMAFTPEEIARHAGRRLHVFALHPSGAGPNPVLPRRDAFHMPMRSDVPLVGDFDCNGVDDYAVWTPATGRWNAKSLGGVVLVDNVPWGSPWDVPLVGDFDSDGCSDDLGAWRPTDGTWHARLRTGAEPGAIIFTNIQWGDPGDVPLVGDFDVDGRIDDLGLWRPSNGTWHARRREGSVIFSPRNWGVAGDIPLVSEAFDAGQPFDQLTIWRPSTGGWYAMRSHGGIFLGGQVQVGLPGDIPLMGDFDSNGSLTELGTWNRMTARWTAKRWTSNTETIVSTTFGDAGDAPFVADFDGDSQPDDLAVWRPSNRRWYARRLNGTVIVSDLQF